MGLAARGARETERGKEMITDPDEMAFFQKRAQRIYLKTFLATLAVMIAGRAWLHFTD